MTHTPGSGDPGPVLGSLQTSMHLRILRTCPIHWLSSIWKSRVLFLTFSCISQALQRLKVQRLFSRDANFSVYDPTGQLWVKSGIHKAVVEVNEEGTEAAAVTFLFLTDLSIKIPKEFTCDRPFFFLIHDNYTKNILFMGVYKQPQKLGKE